MRPLPRKLQHAIRKHEHYKTICSERYKVSLGMCMDSHRICSQIFLFYLRYGNTVIGFISVFNCFQNGK